MEIYTLLSPIIYNGEEIKEIMMDLEDLSVTDLEKCERATRNIFKGRKEVFTGIIEMNKTYQSLVAAKASGLHIQLIRSLKGRDFTQICLLVMNFLLGGDSEEDMAVDPLFTTGKTPNLPTTAIPQNLTEYGPHLES